MIRAFVHRLLCARCRSGHEVWSPTRSRPDHHIAIGLARLLGGAVRRELR